MPRLWLLGRRRDNGLRNLKILTPGSDVTYLNGPTAAYIAVSLSCEKSTSVSIQCQLVPMAWMDAQMLIQDPSQVFLGQPGQEGHVLTRRRQTERWTGTGRRSR